MWNDEVHVLGLQADFPKRAFARCPHAVYRTLEDFLTFKLPANRPVQNSPIGISAAHAVYAYSFPYFRVTPELLGKQTLLRVGGLQYNSGSSIPEQHRNIAIGPVHEW